MKAEQLRKSILQMAIQGKLVPQDPNDEPASVLLERIRAEKQRLIKEGKIKKDKSESIIFKGEDNRYYEKIGKETIDITDDLPFEIPSSWEWVRLRNIFNVVSARRVHKSDWKTEGVPFYRAREIVKLAQQGYVNNELFISESLFDEYKSSGIPHANDIMVTAVGTIGTVYIVKADDRFYYKDASVICFENFYNINAEYIRIVMNSSFMEKQIRSLSAGTTVATITIEKANEYFIPIPPLSEQQRIVIENEKYSPLITEYSCLEEQSAKLDDEIYDKLKKSILQYAIQGKLVHQDDSEEPASVLLERIRAEKKAKLGKKYVESYIYKGDDNCYYEKIGETITNISSEVLFDIPQTWAWSRLKDVCDYVHRGKSPTYGEQKILPIIAQKCNQWDRIYTDRCLFADIASIERYVDEHYLRVGDIIINSTGTGTVGRTGYVTDSMFSVYSKFVADSHVTVVRSVGLINSFYVYLYLISPSIQQDVEARCSGSTNQIELATNTINQYLIPIPPIQEQIRIIEHYSLLLSKIKGEG